MYIFLVKLIFIVKVNILEKLVYKDRKMNTGPSIHDAYGGFG